MTKAIMNNVKYRRTAIRPGGDRMAERIYHRLMRFLGFEEEEYGELDGADEQLARRGEARPPQGAPSQEAEAPFRGQPQPRRPQRVVSLSRGEATGLRMVVVEPHSLDEVQEIADHLKSRRPVIVSLEHVDRGVGKRIIDFLSGTVYALDGHLRKVSEEIFLFAPAEIPIDYLEGVNEFSEVEEVKDEAMTGGKA